MAFVPRSRATIRDALLTNWASRFLAATGEQLLTIEGSDEYMKADALSLELEVFEIQRSALENEILPDKASPPFLTRHGFVEGIDQRAATAAVLPFTITGTPSATVTWGSRTLQSPDGVPYTINGTSVVLNGSGNGAVTGTCAQTGTIGNLAAGTTMTWSSTPTNANPTATVSGSATSLGLPVEDPATYAGRIIAHRQERPASGNRADWRDWVEAVHGVNEAYVYPLVDPSGATSVLGCVTVIPMGIAQGDSPTNTRQVSAGTLTNIAGYLAGTLDVSGASAAGQMLYPATMEPSDSTVSANGLTPQAITLALVLPASKFAAPSWPGPIALDSSSATTLLVAGDHTSIGQTPIYVPISTTVKRGGFVAATPSIAPTYSAGTGKTTFTFTGLPAAPDATRSIYPALPLFSSVATAVFNHFDLLGPGDTSPASRWPTQDVKGRATLFLNSLAADVIAQHDANGNLILGVEGVLTASVSSPASDVVPSALKVVTLDVLTIVWTVI